MNGSSFWASGINILARSVYGGHVRFAVPMTVVSDASDRLIAYQCEGTATLSSTYDAAAARFSEPFTRHWHTSNVLKIYEPDAWAAIWCVWDAKTWIHEYWYVDFQRPIRRTEDGIVTKDLALDIVVSPDLSWKWKDEDHFALRQADGVISRDEAGEVRKEAERILARIEARAAPFNEPWPAWRPDPAWPIPPLPTLAECIDLNRTRT